MMCGGNATIHHRVNDDTNTHTHKNLLLWYLFPPPPSAFLAAAEAGRAARVWGGGLGGLLEEA